MRTFADKPKESPHNTSAKSTLPHWGHVGHGHEAKPILHLQRTIANQARQQMADNHAAVVQGDSAATGIPRLGHDFTRIPVHASDSAPTAYQRRPLALQSRGAGSEASAPSPLSVSEAAPEARDHAASAATALRWQHVKQHRWDALWYFCGEHPSGFSTRATLRADGYTNPGNVEWFVRSGADKVYAPGGFSGPEITLHSSAGSQRPDDVQIEVQEQLPGGAVTRYLGQLTVRKPHRLVQEWTSDHTACPPWDPSPANCPSLWTEISYRVLDNVGGTIVGATVNERFPGPTTHDQPNFWAAAAVTSGSSWPNTNGTFIDNLYQCCGTPAPVPPSSPNWADNVYHEPQEFYVGSTVSGRGCRVQVNTLQFYRGYADHENIRSPAP